MKRIVLVTLTLIAAIAAAAPAAEAATATYTVNSTADHPDSAPGDDQCVADPDGPLGPLPPLAGVCTLRAAMEESNADAEPSLINFNITDPGCSGPGMWCTITLTRDLPTLVESDTTINGFSQPDTNTGTAGSDETPGVPGTHGVANPCEALTFAKPDIAINANIVSSNPFSIDGTASDITIRGLAIYNAGPFNPATMTPQVLAVVSDGHAIVALPGPGVDRFIKENFVGLLPSGDDPGVALRNKEFGIRQLSPGPGNLPGQYAMEAWQNLVGFNGKGGMDSEASDTVVSFRLNEVHNNGWASDAHDGIDINGHDSETECNLAWMNTNFSGIQRADAGNGIEVGSLGSGYVAARAAGLDNNVFRFNTSRHNVSAGFSIRKGPRGNLFEQNVSHHNEVGIAVNVEERFPTNRNTFTRNSTFSNMTIGIDLVVAPFLRDPVTGGLLLDVAGFPIPAVGDGPTPNDHCDVDGDGGGDGSHTNTASNDLQNFPILTSASTFGTVLTRIEGTLNSTPDTTFIIEFFRTPSDEGSPIDPLGGEGKFFIGSIIVTTGSLVQGCTATFTFDAPPQPAGDEITATARIFRPEPEDAPNLWSTSEYSPPVPVDNVVPEGKVTGGGYIVPGAPTCADPCDDDNSSNTRGNFGFIAQYHKDDPDPRGHTNFVYRPGRIHFSSTDYALLSLSVTRVTDPVTGKTEEKATWRGEGKLNQEKRPTHCFRVNTTDRGEPGTTDSFRIKIWQGVSNGSSLDCSVETTVVFDSDPTETETKLGGGNVQVHPPLKQ
jgi:CSLREA domain-containing protein